MSQRHLKFLDSLTQMSFLLAFVDQAQLSLLGRREPATLCNHFSHYYPQEISITGILNFDGLVQVRRPSSELHEGAGISLVHVYRGCRTEFSIWT